MSYLSVQQIIVPVVSNRPAASACCAQRQVAQNPRHKSPRHPSLSIEWIHWSEQRHMDAMMINNTLLQWQGWQKHFIPKVPILQRTHPCSCHNGRPGVLTHPWVSSDPPQNGTIFDTHVVYSWQAEHTAAVPTEGKPMLLYPSIFIHGTVSISFLSPLEQHSRKGRPACIA